MDIYTADALEAAADILGGYSDRGPSANREDVLRLAAALRDVATDARSADCGDSISVTLRF